jgi:hypothetical protein
MEAGMAGRILVAIVLMLGAANAAQAIECKALPDMTIQGTWQWQIIDGRFCWYLGDRSTPKEQLRWPGPEQALPRRLAALPAGQKIQCQAQVDKAKGGRWSWRLVDNRQCWFVGERDTPREWLQWPPQEQSELRKQFGESPQPELRKQFDESAERQELPEDVQKMLQFTEQPPESMHGWQIVNQESGGDLEFIARDAWMAFLSIDLNIGAEYLTDVPMTYWPVLTARTPQLDQMATVAN